MKTKKQINEWVWVKLWKAKDLKKTTGALEKENIRKILKSLDRKFGEQEND